MQTEGSVQWGHLLNMVRQNERRFNLMMVLNATAIVLILSMVVYVVIWPRNNWMYLGAALQMVFVVLNMVLFQKNRKRCRKLLEMRNQIYRVWVETPKQAEVHMQKLHELVDDLKRI